MTGVVPSVSCSHKKAHDTSRLSEACDTYEKTSLGDQKLGTNKERSLLKKQVSRDIRTVYEALMVDHNLFLKLVVQAIPSA